MSCCIKITSEIKLVFPSVVSWLGGPRPLLELPLGFLKLAAIPRRKPGSPGQCHSGKPERDPGESVAWLAESGVTFQLGPHLSP